MDYGIRKPRILIVGAGFRNQGAYLMLVAAVQQVRDLLGGQPVIEARLGTQRQRDELGLETMLGWQRFQFAPKAGGRDTLRNIKDQLPFVFASDIDAVFDASGFAFSDQWNVGAHLRRRSDYLKMWSESVPVYMLPQALGPFEESKDVCHVALSSAALVYARDPDSLKFARTLTNENHHIRSAPDFTIGMEGSTKLHPDLSLHYEGVAIVPNWNILKRAPTEHARNAYIESLIAAATISREKGYHVYGLGHEGKNDLKILEMVSERVPHFPIVSGLNGLESKALLKTARFTISGRFHAIISALSQGVPTVIHGWSHKYRWLSDDFGVEELRCDPYDVDSMRGSLELIDSESPRIIENLRRAKAPLVNASTEMWEEIHNDLLLRISPSRR